MKKCIKCGSHAFNLYADEIDQGGFCDVHYWQGRAHRAEALAQDKQWTPERIAGMARLKEAQDKKLAQPEQEPVAWVWRYDSCGHAVVNRLVVTETSEPTLFLKNVFARGPFPLYAAPLPAQPPLPVQEPHNFCPRCGKRAQGVLGQPQIHTCTPPLWGHK